MKKKIAALLLCAVLSATSLPVTGMAGEFSATSEDVSKALKSKNDTTAAFFC